MVVPNLYYYRVGCSFYSIPQAANHMVDMLAKWEVNQLISFVRDFLIPPSF